MVPKIIRTNHNDVKAPMVPVMSISPPQIKAMYPKYSMYVINILEASNDRNQTIL